MILKDLYDLIQVFIFQASLSIAEENTLNMKRFFKIVEFTKDDSLFFENKELINRPDNTLEYVVFGPSMEDSDMLSFHPHASSRTWNFQSDYPGGELAG